MYCICYILQKSCLVLDCNLLDISITVARSFSFFTLSFFYENTRQFRLQVSQENSFYFSRYQLPIGFKSFYRIVFFKKNIFNSSRQMYITCHDFLSYKIDIFLLALMNVFDLLKLNSCIKVISRLC